MPNFSAGPKRHFFGSWDLDARGSFGDELPGRCLHVDRRLTRGQVAHPRSLAIERRERRRLAEVRVRAARGPWKSRPHLLLHYSLIYTHK